MYYNYYMISSHAQHETYSLLFFLIHPCERPPQLRIFKMFHPSNAPTHPSKNEKIRDILI